MKTLIVVATFNEIENLPELLRQICAAAPEADVLIVDDNSPDGTGLWAQAESEKRSNLFCLVRINNRGLGSAVLDAIRYGIENNYDFIVNLDADLSHSPAEIPKMLRRIDENKADVVIGSRYVNGGRIVGWPLRRRFMSRCVNIFARFVLGLKTRDNSGSFRCYRVSVLKKLNLEQVRSKGYSFFEEILYRMQKNGAKMEEIPITFTERERGCSKVNLREAFRSIFHLLRLGALIV